jgi:hypothetical protein
MSATLSDREFKTIIVFWSATGNTGKGGRCHPGGLAGAGIKPVVCRVAEAAAEDLYDYDLVFFGAPSYSFQPPPPVQRYIQAKMKLHRDRGDIKPGAPVMPGKTAVVFCTYSGPHTSIREATPVGDVMGQLFEHIGFAVPGNGTSWASSTAERYEHAGKAGISGAAPGPPTGEVTKNVAAVVQAIRSAGINKTAVSAALAPATASGATAAEGDTNSMA